MMVSSLPMIGTGEGAGPDNDGVAADGGVDRRLDGGVAAIAHEQEVVAGAVVDLLDAGEQIGALGPPALTCQPDWLPAVVGSASTTAVTAVASSVPV